MSGPQDSHHQIINYSTLDIVLVCFLLGSRKVLKYACWSFVLIYRFEMVGQSRWVTHLANRHGLPRVFVTLVVSAHRHTRHARHTRDTHVKTTAKMHHTIGQK